MDSLDERRARLAELNEKMRRCVACPLSKGRTKVVPGEGRIDADIMFIGEAPGYYEDQQGRPFVGAAGQFLEQLLASIGLKRSDVFIANVIKCRPPSNRDPLPNEIDSCSGWLDQQVDIIQPKVIVTLGRYSLARFFPGTPISRIHGQGRKLALSGAEGFGRQFVVPMYHPAAALHQGSLRRVIEEDFKKIPAFVDQALQEDQAARLPPTPADAHVLVTSGAPTIEQGRLF